MREGIEKGGTRCFENGDKCLLCNIQGVLMDLDWNCYVLQDV